MMFIRKKGNTTKAKEKKNEKGKYGEKESSREKWDRKYHNQTLNHYYVRRTQIQMHAEQ